MPGMLLADRYELIERVGRGATGEVWRARDRRLDRVVAVKTVRVSANPDNPGAVARFRRESTASAAINSPHIVSVYDAGRDGPLAFLVMELLPGQSLKDIIESDGPLGLDNGLRIAADVARGLADAHAVGFVHRDLKPGNVVMGNSGDPKIVDFGIARLADPGDETMTAATTVAGTAAYMSPEQAMGDQVGTAGDMYSLGCLLFTIFTGAPPFPDGSAVEQATAQVNDIPPLLSQRRPDAPEDLVALTGRLLSKAPDDRPTAAQTARELDRIRLSLDGATPDIPPLVLAPSAPATQPSAWAAVPAEVAEVPASPEPVPPPAPRRGGFARALPWIVTAVLAIAAVALVIALANQNSSDQTATPTITTTVALPSPTPTPSLALPTVSAPPTHETTQTPATEKTKTATTAPTTRAAETPSQTATTSAPPATSTTPSTGASGAASASAAPTHTDKP